MKEARTTSQLSRRVMLRGLALFLGAPLTLGLESGCTSDPKATQRRADARALQTLWGPPPEMIALGAEVIRVTGAIERHIDTLTLTLTRRLKEAESARGDARGDALGDVLKAQAQAQAQARVQAQAQAQAQNKSKDAQDPRELGARSPSVNAVARALYALHLESAERGEWVEVRGWRLSRVEAASYALIALGE